MEKIEAIVSTLDFVAISGETLMRLKPNGVIEFGEKYRNNPDAAAREFIRLVAKLWPELVEASRLDKPEAERQIRKAGQVAIDGIIDGWSDRTIMPDSDDLAEYLTRIVDACVSAADMDAAHVASVNIREELTERDHELMQGRARYLEDQESHHLHAIVDAWEALPGGRQVKYHDVEIWLAKDMAPAINAIRTFLQRSAPIPERDE